MFSVDLLVKTGFRTSAIEWTRRSSRRTATHFVLACAAIGAFCSLVANAQVNVTTQHNDIARTGQNLNETILNTSNVNSSQFGKLFSQPVDGLALAQPLYLSGIAINGATHNVLFVATEHDSVYAFDADTNAGANANPLWQASMLSSAHGAATGATTVPWSAGSDIYPEVGITGTPVIDPVSGTLYVVSKSLEGGAQLQRLHALDVTTGAEKFGSPVTITASVAGTAADSVAGIVSFNPRQENQRAGLLLLNSIVYVGFASHEDGVPWHGWILGYNAATLKQTGVFCTSPNGTAGGVWMSGAGLAADQLDPVNHPYGRMFVATGNGDYTATKPYSGNMDYGDSHLNLDLTGGVPTITDEFTTNQQAKLNANDGDVGAGGVMILPTLTTGSDTHLLVQAGKGGTLYLLNRDNLGGYNTTADQALQEQAYSVGNVGVWSSPAYWNGNVYYWGQFDNLKSFAMVGGLLSTVPTKSTEQYAFPGATPSISANGSVQGIVWTIDAEDYGTGGAAILQAHNATNVGTTLYSSTTNTARDSAGPAVKFAVPTIANGKVYVNTANQIDIYGLLGGLTQTDAPSITPGTESFLGSATVTITDGTANASIYYTTDGTAATTASTVYSQPILVNTSETINAIAAAPGLLISAQASATYTSVSQATATVFSQPTGIYTSAQTVSLSDATANTTIYYTTDGSKPTTSSTVYTGPITVSTSETISAMAIGPGLTSSPVIAQTYTIEPGQSGISFGQGFAGSSSLVVLNGGTITGNYLQLTAAGLTGKATAVWYHSPVNVQSFTTDFTFQLLNAQANGFTFAIQNSPANINALGGNGFELGYAPIPNSVAVKFDLYDSNGEGTNSTGLYLNGAAPTVPAIDLSATGINLHSGDTMGVHLVYDGTTLTMTISDLVTGATWSTAWTVNIPSDIGSNTAYVGFTAATGGLSATQNILSWTYFAGAATPVAATPTLLPAAGTYTSTQSVSISDTTPGATIYYTTNGTTPTTASSVYSGAITVSATETLKAIAVAAGYATSAVGSAAYTITPLVAATPTFLPAAGTYTSTQSVSISDTTAAATIYYTTNGTTPTTASSVYSGAITVSATETLKAIAVANSYSTSAVGSAAYTITPLVAATPTFSPAAGTYATTQSVTIGDTTPGATIYYTTNGTTPTTASSVYSGAITVSATETLQAIAVANSYSTSAVGSAAYTISSSSPPVVNYPTGFTTSTGFNLVGATIASGALQLTDGGSGEQRAVWFATPVNVQKFTTDFNFQETSATADGFTFAIQNSAANVWAIGGNGGSLGYGGIGSSVAVKFDLYNNAGEGSDSTGFYVNGAVPTVPSLDMTASGVNLHSGDILHAHITYDGATLTLTLTDTVTNASFTASTAINIPATVGGNTAYVGFTAGTGGLSATQKILNWSYAVN
jgi:Chitobiase/beta-hexosaminidase C-terminal domain/Legume lectin domain/Bacterial lectin